MDEPLDSVDSDLAIIGRRNSSFAGPYFNAEVSDWRALRILVVGAGGLGCELLHNLALSKFTDVTVIDMDTIEISNLNRQFLFREHDIGKYKAQVAADFINQRFPHMNVMPYTEPIEHFPPSFYAQFNIVLLGLDSVHARWWINDVYTKLERIESLRRKAARHRRRKAVRNNRSPSRVTPAAEESSGSGGEQHLEAKRKRMDDDHYSCYAPTNNDPQLGDVVTTHIKRIHEDLLGGEDSQHLADGGVGHIDGAKELHSSGSDTSNEGDEDDAVLRVVLIDGGTEGFRGSLQRVEYGRTACIECTAGLLGDSKNIPFCTVANTPRSLEHCVLFASELLWPRKNPFGGTRVKCDADNAEHMKWVRSVAIHHAQQYELLPQESGSTESSSLLDLAFVVGVVKHVIPSVGFTNALIAGMAVQEAVSAATDMSSRSKGLTSYSGLEGCCGYTVDQLRREDCLACQPLHEIDVPAMRGDGTGGDVSVGAFLQHFVAPYVEQAMSRFHSALHYSPTTSSEVGNDVATAASTEEEARHSTNSPVATWWTTLQVTVEAEMPHEEPTTATGSAPNTHSDPSHHLVLQFAVGHPNATKPVSSEGSSDVSGDPPSPTMTYNEHKRQQRLHQVVCEYLHQGTSRHHVSTLQRDVPLLDGQVFLCEASGGALGGVVIPFALSFV